MTSRARNVIRALLTVWILGTGQFGYYYGNQPIFTGSDSPTLTQTEAVEVKGRIKYVSPKEKMLLDVSRSVFFGTIGLLLALFSLKVYGPAAWRSKLEKLDKDLRW
jgi:hypothetical protein